MSTSGVLAVVMVFLMVPGGVLSDMRGTRGLEAQQLAQSSTLLHRRLKRSWIWKQLFVPEEDPTPRVIGQVKLHTECPPCPWYSAFCLKIPSLSPLPADQIGLWPRRVFHQVHIIRRRGRRHIWDRRVFWRDPYAEEARPRGKSLLHPSSSGYQQEDQWTRGAAVRVHHPGAGHQWQHPPVPEWALRVQHPRDVSNWYVWEQ